MARLHFIGGGQMAEAIIRALIKNQLEVANDISVYDVDIQRSRLLQERYAINAVTLEDQAITKADLIIIAVRPQDDLVEVGRYIKQYAQAAALIVSIVAGVTIARLEELCGETRAIARIIPNTLTDTGFGYSGVAVNQHASIEVADRFIHGFGKSIHIEEQFIDIFTAVAVCGPNYIYYFIEALIDAGVLAGLPRSLTKQVTLENMVGAVEMLKQSGLHPRELLDINNSPAGVGMHLLYELNNSDFTAGLQRSVLAAVKRTTELGKE